MLLLALAAVAVVGVLVVVGGRRASLDRNPPSEGRRPGPTGEPYPPGSNPAGPDAESMGLVGPGHVAPGPTPPPRPPDGRPEEDHAAP